MNIVLFYFLLLIVFPAMLIAWGVRIVKLFTRKDYKPKTRFLEAGILLGIIVLITWDIGIFPMSKNFYVKELSKEITGKSFWCWKEFAFDEISVRGEGYSIFAYKYDKEIAEYFLEPDEELFNEYPKKPEYRKNWESTKWRKTPITPEEKLTLEIATPNYASWKQFKLDKMEFVRELANSEGNYYSYNTNNADVDFYLINPENRLIIMINHNQ